MLPINKVILLKIITGNPSWSVLSFRAFSSSCLVFNKATPPTGRHNAKEGSTQSDRGSHEYDVKKLRNIGIIAHINAGKTTTTERILYHAGSTDTVGDVDRGNTVTDYLIQERDRGITITSAAVTYYWKKHRVNLIDTPGHVDFTIEVERSLSVLDGAITLIDSSAGVEAQTISVWNQASKYHLPNIIFLNKCDKPQANIDMCMKDLRSQLNINANLIQLPLKLSSQKQTNFDSIIDLINRNLITWNEAGSDHGSKFIIQPLHSVNGLDKKYLELVEMEREKLINSLSDCDEDLAGHVISCDKIGDVSGEALVRALRQATISCKISPVLVGSSFKYIGVQQLADAIIDYLPDPLERRIQIQNSLVELDTELVSSNENACAFIFKIMHDKRFGALNYLRIYNGSVSRLQRLKNLETGKVEQIKKVYRAFADELKEITTPVGKDDIVVVTGLTESRTGDVLVNQSLQQTQEPLEFDEDQVLSDGTVDSNRKSPFQLLGRHIIVPKISRLEPVYFCSIEASSISQQLKLEQALERMAREDPSLTYEIDSMGMTTIRGMGKLHLEVARDRIETEYGVTSILGRLQISYRETIDGFATEELTVNRLINSVNNSLSIKLYVRSKPASGAWTAKHLRLDTSGENSLSRLRNDHRKAIENGFKSALMHGPSLGFPMIDCDILLLDFKANGRCGLPVISSAASQCLMSAVSRCSPVLLEPTMLLEVVIPAEYNGIIISDITSTRRGLVLSTTARANGTIIVRSKTPLSTLSNYSEYLRITTSGRGCFSMELHSYSAMSESDKQNLVRL